MTHVGQAKNQGVLSAVTHADAGGDETRLDSDVSHDPSHVLLLCLQ